MSKLQDMIDKRAVLWEESKKFLDEHTDKDGKISAEDAETYDKMKNVRSCIHKRLRRV